MQMRPTILILKCAGSHQHNSTSPYSEIHESRVTNSNFWCFVFHKQVLASCQISCELATISLALLTDTKHVYCLHKFLCHANGLMYCMAL